MERGQKQKITNPNITVFEVPNLGTIILPLIWLEKKLETPKTNKPNPNSDSLISNLSMFQGIWTKYILIINIIRNALTKDAFLSLLNFWSITFIIN